MPRSCRSGHTQSHPLRPGGANLLAFPLSPLTPFSAPNPNLFLYFTGLKCHCRRSVIPVNLQTHATSKLAAFPLGNLVFSYNSYLYLWFTFCYFLMCVHVLGGCSVWVEGALWGWGDGVCACIWRPEDNSGLTLSNLSDSFETVFFSHWPRSPGLWKTN